MPNEQMKWRVFLTVATYSSKHLRKWLKLRLLKSHVVTHLKMIRARTDFRILNYEVLYLRSNVDYARRMQRWNPRRGAIWQTKFARSSRRAMIMTRDHTHPPNRCHRGDPHVGRPQ